MARGQQLVRVDEEVEHHIPPGAEQVVLAQLERALAGADILLLEDYNKGLLTPGVIAGALSRSKPGSVPTVVDPKFKHFFRYRGATVFKPNKHELARAMGDTFDPGTLSGLSRCRADVGADNLLLTLGSQGMVLVTKDGEVTRIPAVAREVFDVSGAGDTVTAWVGAALGAGATMFEAAQIANFAAGVEVGKLGVATPSPAEVLAAYDAYSDHLATSDCRREPE